ncbi:hypothetical protein NHX12_014071 [Muraenolepis orangiensis]|uniref:CCHC-type domain-containing protein n=1 Tax=Muraenolepis orangiensis TaxID=630683 RepID=A0A9Q0DE75_9TELE|nr:hypothetical protein NHX12_013970 [Muraenolepis orangiensis]KAJ3585350.1 hypothetical protein NHX12_014071 [Muraenolepis orangiensis]
MKCFGCVSEGHVVRACPSRRDQQTTDPGEGTSGQSQAGTPAVVGSSTGQSSGEAEGGGERQDVSGEGLQETVNGGVVDEQVTDNSGAGGEQEAGNSGVGGEQEKRSSFVDGGQETNNIMVDREQMADTSMEDGDMVLSSVTLKPGGRSGSWSDQHTIYSSILGLRSSRVVRRFLEQWDQRLTAEERGMLRDYGSGMATPDKRECFPDIRLTPALGELAGPLLTSRTNDGTTLFTANSNQTEYPQRQTV